MEGARELTKILSIPKYPNDFWMFRVHYKLTIAAFVFCAVLISGKQLFGAAIACEVHGFSQHYAESDCWMGATYTLPYLSARHHQLYPGVGPLYYDGKKLGPIVYQTFYQYYALALFIQSLLFYLPRYIWKNVEQKKLQYLVEDLRKKENEKDSPALKILLESTANSIYKRRELHHRRCITYYILECLNCCIVALQAVFMHLYLNYTFITLGLEVLGILNNNPLPRAYAFPKHAKCNLRRYGPSGTAMIIDAICVLPLNDWNEKIFVILWFWMVVLFLVSMGYCLFNFIPFITMVWRGPEGITGKGHYMWSFLGITLYPDVVEELRVLCLEEAGTVNTTEKKTD